MTKQTNGNGNGARTKTEAEPRLWWFLVTRAHDLELRQRRGEGNWRFTCPVDAAHEVTLANGKPGLALTCHGPAGAGPGHALVVHQRLREGTYTVPEGFADELGDLDDVAYPCRFCGCTESMVLAAFGAKGRDKFKQPADGLCRCGCVGNRVNGVTRCLTCLADHVGLDRAVLFGEHVSSEAK
jgi:hypothetical protein